MVPNFLCISDLYLFLVIPYNLFSSFPLPPPKVFQVFFFNGLYFSKFKVILCFPSLIGVGVFLSKGYWNPFSSLTMQPLTS